MIRLTRLSRFVLLVATAAGATLLGACSAGTSDPNYGHIRYNLTPGLATLDKRHIDVDRDTGLTFNENRRMLSEDFLRAGLYDRPSRLSAYPIPH